MPKKSHTHSDDQPGPLANGTGTEIDQFDPGKDPLVNAIMKGVKWAGGRISYSFPDSAADYGPGYVTDNAGLLDENANSKDALHDGFAELGILQKQAVHQILKVDLTSRPWAAGFAVEGFTNLKIDFAGSGNGNGTIRIARTDDTVGSPRSAGAYVVPLSEGGTGAGDAFMGPKVDLLSNQGSRSYYFFLHELGHSLGLKHGHVSENGWPELDANHNSNEYSVMTYAAYKGAPTEIALVQDSNAPQSFMMLDIAALQQMYGANYSVNSGNTVYHWDPASGSTWVNGRPGISAPFSAILATVWDGGGVDTYDLSAYANDLKIDLRPGEWSTFSAAQIANLNMAPESTGGPKPAVGNIANALLFEGNTASLIENAIGGAAADRITGNQADNSLTGGLGNDTLNGLGGNDLLSGNAGSDTMDGGAGNDTVNYNDHILSITLLLSGSTTATASSGADRDKVVNVENIYGGQAADRFRGDDFDNVIRGRGGNDEMNGGAGSDTIDFMDKTTKVLITLNGSTVSKAVTDLVIDEVDSFVNFENVIGGQAGDGINGDGGANRLDGFNGNDLISGNGGDDTLLGGAGADGLNGGSGNDRIEGGDGADTITGADGNDTLLGGAGVDKLYGGAGNDRFVELPDGDSIYGDEGIDTVDYSDLTTKLIAVMNGNDTGSVGALGKVNVIHGIEIIKSGSGDDEITGDKFANTLWGGAGDDVINDGAGGDTVMAEEGQDLVIAGDLVMDNDSWDGGEGIDTITFEKLSVAAGNIPVFNLETNKLRLNGASEGLSGFENLTGSAGTDFIIGSSYNNTLNGAGGNDVIEGRDGWDRLIGGEGDDVLAGGTGYNTLIGGAGIDTASYSAWATAVHVTLEDGNGTADMTIGRNLDSLQSIENVIGGAGNDTISGGNDDNTLTGGLGDDLLIDGGGTDHLYGREGNDTLKSTDIVFGNDVFDGGDGLDTFSLDDLDVKNTIGNPVTIDLAAQAVLYNGGADTLVSIENATGSNYADVIFGDSGANFLAGRAGNDRIEGNEGADIIRGGTGNDILTGGDGTDDIRGGDGNDTITDYSFDGSVDVINGGAGDDQLFNEQIESGGSWDGGDGIDTLHLTGENMDNYTIDLGAPSFLILGTSFRSIENLFTSIGDDTITGSGGGNILDGGRGADVIRGMGGNDTVAGGEDNDVLYGNGGADALRGGRGADTLFGGSGADRFVFELTPNGEVDTLADMTTGVDKIVLSAAAFGFASAGPLAASAFVIGTAAADADDRIIYDTATGSIFFDADGNGAGASVQFATVALSANLNLGDFLVA